MLLGPKANLMPSRKTKNYFVSSLCDNGGGCAMSWRAQSRSKKWFRFSRARVIRCQVELGLCGIQRYPGTPPGHPRGTPKLDPGTPPGTAPEQRPRNYPQRGQDAKEEPNSLELPGLLVNDQTANDIHISKGIVCGDARAPSAPLIRDPLPV
jgi:hypothetical protein